MFLQTGTSSPPCKKPSPPSRTTEWSKLKLSWLPCERKSTTKCLSQPDQLLKNSSWRTAKHSPCMTVILVLQILFSTRSIQETNVRYGSRCDDSLYRYYRSLTTKSIRCFNKG